MNPLNSSEEPENEFLGYNSQYPETSWELSMTIGIAALCDNGKTCVVCADRKVQNAYSGSSSIPFVLEYESGGKIIPITDRCAIVLAGDLFVAHEVVERTRAHILSNGNASKMTIEEITNLVQYSYLELHVDRAESSILRPRGITLKEFRLGGVQMFPLETYQEIDRKILEYGVPVSHFLVIGSDEKGAYIFRVRPEGGRKVGVERSSPIGFRSVGSGEAIAEIVLVSNGHTIKNSIDRTLYNVYCAKRSAEFASGVGKSTDMAVITSSGIEFVDTETIARLEAVRDVVTQRSQPADDEIKGLYITGQEEKPL